MTESCPNTATAIDMPVPEECHCIFKKGHKPPCRCNHGFKMPPLRTVPKEWDEARRRWPKVTKGIITRHRQLSGPPVADRDWSEDDI